MSHGTSASVPSASWYADGIRRGDSAVLARAITLVESTASHHAATAAELMRLLLPHEKKSIRVGITGVPGVGKSTFIEAFGLHLCDAGHRVAVLAVDPSSVISGGSILGDKTRMEKLARHASAYIRPSPSGGALGGVNRQTRETMVLCEAAGYDAILVETVGVGQSEIAVRSMTDFFLLLALTGAGDELQGIKKGIVEMADGIVVTKADGANVVAAEKLRLEFSQVLRFLHPATEGWSPEVLKCSSLTHEGIGAVWALIEKFCQAMQASGAWNNRRLRQAHEGLMEFAREQVVSALMTSKAMAGEAEALGESVVDGKVTLRDAATQIAQDFFKAP